MGWNCLLQNFYIHHLRMYSLTKQYSYEYYTLKFPPLLLDHKRHDQYIVSCPLRKFENRLIC